jgi:hypothetical protein
VRADGQHLPTLLRRHGSRHAAPRPLPDGSSFTCAADTRLIIEVELTEPVYQNETIVLPPGDHPPHQQIRDVSAHTGTPPRCIHAVLGFGPSGAEHVAAVLDCAATQFHAQSGRGPGGESFRLDTMDAFWDWCERTHLGSRMAPGKEAGGSKRVGLASPEDEAWFADVAHRVRRRWDARDTEHWCARCGGPVAKGPSTACRCGAAFFCTPRCYKLNWRFHRKHCAARKPAAG